MFKGYKVTTVSVNVQDKQNQSGRTCKVVIFNRGRVAHLNHTVQSYYCKVDYDLKFTLEKSPKQGAFLNSIKFETEINYLIPSYIEMKHVI